MASPPPTTVSLSLSPTDTLLRTITAAGLPNLTINPTTTEKAHSSITLESGELAGPNTIAQFLAPRLFPGRAYSELEQAEISQWLTLSADFESASTEKKEFLQTLNAHFKSRTTLLGEKPSVADVAVYVRVRDAVSQLSADERTGGEQGGLRYLVRWVDFVQNAPGVFGGVRIPEEEKIKVDVGDVRTVVKADEPPAKEKKDGAAGEGGAGGKKDKKNKEKKGGAAAVVEEAKEKVVDKAGEAKKVVEKVAESVVDTASAAVAGATAGAAPEAGKKEKKEKKPKAPKAPAAKKEEPALSPSLIDFRVGHILDCVPHPNADSLYMSTIFCGDAPDSAYTTPTPDHPTYPPTRTVLSGLRGKVPIEEMRGRKVIVVCNLKPANMRGIRSSAMVLAASTAHGAADEKVELVTPPPNAQPGERVYFEGYGVPEDGQLPQLNPKNKVFETLGAGFATTEDCGVAFDGGKVFTGEEAKSLDKGVGKLVAKSGGACTVQTLKGAVVR